MNKKLFFAIGLIANFTFAQTYENGGLSTGATAKSGVAAPTGYTWSELQSNTGSTTESNTTTGYQVTSNENAFLADDFTIPPGSQWQISSIDFFGYDSGYTDTTNPYTTVRVNIYSSDPSVAGAVSIFGDDTTNRFLSGENAFIYRIGNTAVPASSPSSTSTSRRIFKIKANTPVTLGPGTYWIKYQLDNVVLANGGSSPLVTVIGSRGLPGFNAKTYDTVANTWSPIIDKGKPSTAPDVNMDIPFIITYTSATLGTNETVQYDNRVQVYPNPVKDVFKISNAENTNAVEILDTSGKLVKAFKGSEQYNVSDLPKGNYIVSIKSNGTTKITKLIKN